LGEEPHGEDVGLLGIGEHDSFASVEHTEVGGTVGNDSNDGDTETTVESLRAIGGSDLLEAVNQTSELTLSTGSNISGKTGSCKIEWVDEAQRGGTSCSTGGAVSNEELDGFLLGVVWVEDLLVSIFASKVKCLGGEVPDDVGHVASPERGESLFLQDS